ncbi:glycosyltransferase family 2 protein [Microbacterium sp. M1A1_1b]
MPARDAAVTLRHALVSTLRSAPRDTELLVMDDGSEDRTAEVARNVDDRRVRVLRSAQGLGVASALNALLDEARGEYVARMDADDVSLPGRFHGQLQRLKSGVDFTFGGVIHFGKGLPIPYPSPLLSISTSAFPVALLIENPVAHSTMAARTDALRTLGGYRACLAEDYDLWLRAAGIGLSLERVSRPLVALRRHRGQVTASSSWAERAATEAEWQDAYSTLVSVLHPGLEDSQAIAIRAAGSPSRKNALLGYHFRKVQSRFGFKDRVALSVLRNRRSD